MNRIYLFCRVRVSELNSERLIQRVLVTWVSFWAKTNTLVLSRSAHLTVLDFLNIFIMIQLLIFTYDSLSKHYIK